MLVDPVTREGHDVTHAYLGASNNLFFIFGLAASRALDVSLAHWESREAGGGRHGTEHGGEPSARWEDSSSRINYVSFV